MQMKTSINNKKADNSLIINALSEFNLPSIRQYQRAVKTSNLSHIPGDRGLPLLGHTYWFLTGFHKWLNKQYRKYGPVFKMLTPQGDMVFLLGPEGNDLVLKNEHGTFSNFLAWDNVFRGLFDNNLLVRDFANHKVQRRILQSAFKRQAIIGHMEIMNPVIRTGLDSLPSGKTVKTVDFVKKLLLDTGAKVFLGVEIGDEAEQINQAFTDIVAGTADPFKRKEIWFSPYARGVKGKETISKFVFNEIEGRREGNGIDILSQFCRLTDDDGQLYSPEQIRDHINFVLFAAHDTTTSALCSTLYSLATHTQWQEELRQEIQLLGKQELEIDDLDSLEKMALTIKESLRMYPPLSAMPRFALEEFEFQGHRIPANTLVSVSSVFTHYMPEYWSNPNKFDPMRFPDERAEHKKNFFQYIPFGGGAHKCLGLHFAEVQGKMVLYYLLKNYKISKSPQMKRFNHNNIPLTFPSDDLPLRFERIT